MVRLHDSKKAAPPTGTLRQWCGCLTFFAKCGILNFEGIPETVGGSLSLGESAVAISAGRRAGQIHAPTIFYLNWWEVMHDDGRNFLYRKHFL